MFNHITGLQQKITNIPGTTIERREGSCTLGDKSLRIIDTPGTYSRTPRSMDEEVALEIFKEGHPDRPDLIVYVADANNLKRNLLYFSQLCDTGIPMILVLNMMDVASFKGLTIDIERLEKELGIKVLKTNARTGDGVDDIRKALTADGFVPHYDFSAAPNEEDLVARYRHIDALLSKVLTRKGTRELLTERLDPILTHPVFGYLIFVFVLLIIFQSVFTLAQYPMELIESGFSYLGNQLMEIMSPGWFRSLVVNGIVAGLSGVIVFIPQIAILFFFMAVLEDTGYMARVSFIMDRILRGLGLNGKSVVPLLSGAACAIPAIMATRHIENWKDRLITILVTPLMSCSARLPVYTLLISMAVPNTYVWGFINMKALALLAMYILGAAASMIAALVFKLIIKQRSLNYFIMELPIYHPPRWKNIGMIVMNKSKSFVNEAGKIILIVSVVLWFLASYGPHPNQPGLHVKESANIEESYAGHIGKVIEPTIEPLGFNWKIGIALITSFAAREVFVGTMSTIYSVDDEDNIASIRSKMQNDTDPVTGKPIYSLAVVFSLMIFYAFAMQCISTLAVVYKETRSMKWPVIQFLYMTGLAYICSLITYQLLK